MGGFATGVSAFFTEQSQSSIPARTEKKRRADCRSFRVSSIPPLLRQRLRAEAGELRCAYCHSPERLLGIPLEADHIIATARGGKTVIANLCLSCRTCNGRKWQITTAR